MHNENLDLIMAHMFHPEQQTKKLTEGQQQLLMEVTDCYNLQLQKPMIGRTALRAYLINKYGCSKIQAYKIIQYAAVCLGDVQPSHKNWVRQRIEFLSERAYEAVEAGDYKRAEAITKIAGTLAKAFQTNLDEGELINAQKYLEIAQVRITMDETVLGIKITEPGKKEIERLLRKYEITDVPFTDVPCEEIKEGENE